MMWILYNVAVRYTMVRIPPCPEKGKEKGQGTKKEELKQ